MTNQQGAPEALRPIARYKIGYHTDEWGMRSSTPSGIPDRAGAWVRYEDHVAALQAQRPAPSVAAAGEVPLPLLVRDIAADLGTTPIQVCTALAQLGFGGHSVNMVVTPRMAKSLRAHFASPTPQADSAPTSGNWVSADDVNRLVRELDVALNGKAGAAAQASLCDVVAQVRLEAAKRGQPLLAPQADSQPAPNNEAILSAARNWGDVQQYNRTDGKGTEHRIVFSMPRRAAHFARELLRAAPADSQPAPVLDERAAFAEHWQKNDGRPPITWEALFAQQGTETPTHCAGRYFLRETQTAWEAWQARAARAPADSVTAPAGGVDDDVNAVALARYKVVPAHESMFHRFAVVAGDGKQQLYLGREIECANMAHKFAGAFLDGVFYQSNIAPTPPAQAADSVLEDAARYQWLRNPTTDVALVLDKRTGYVPVDEQVPSVGGYYTYEYRSGAELDAAIDAARKQGGANG